MKNTGKNTADPNLLVKNVVKGTLKSSSCTRDLEGYNHKYFLTYSVKTLFQLTFNAF